MKSATSNRDLGHSSLPKLSDHRVKVLRPEVSHIVSAVKEAAGDHHYSRDEPSN